jgi:hypothetical protein
VAKCIIILLFTVLVRFFYGALRRLYYREKHEVPRVVNSLLLLPPVLDAT